MVQVQEHLGYHHYFDLVVYIFIYYLITSVNIKYKILKHAVTKTK